MTLDTVPGHSVVRTLEIASAVGATRLPPLAVESTTADEQMRLHASAAASARRSALEGLRSAATRQGANVVLGVRFETQSVVLDQPFVVVTAHGTPCVVEAQTRPRPTSAGPAGASVAQGLRTAAAAAHLWDVLDDA